MAKIGRLSRSFRVTSGKKFRLKDFDPNDTGGVKSKARAVELLRMGVERMAELQDRLFAQDRRSLLVVLQAMDAAGKDGVISHVMSGVNPQGCQVYSFKSPSTEELDHDFLWRTAHRAPERGRIGIFNRSYYEEVLIVRVHPAILAAQHLPPELVTPHIWKERFDDINGYERMLTRNGTTVLKFFLYVSKQEQKRRFLSRLDQPAKNWKFSSADVREREHWNEYMKAYEEMIQHTSHDYAPWYIVPADNKWFTRLTVADAIIDALEGMKLDYPKVDEAKKRELVAAREMLLRGREIKQARSAKM
jgi:PPK2 family polyphosphate:nucleotide phosphotransferase